VLVFPSSLNTKRADGDNFNAASFSSYVLE
jgi:hypothetical protein